MRGKRVETNWITVSEKEKSKRFLVFAGVIVLTIITTVSAISNAIQSYFQYQSMVLISNALSSMEVHNVDQFNSSGININNAVTGDIANGSTTDHTNTIPTQKSEERGGSQERHG